MAVLAAQGTRFKTTARLRDDFTDVFDEEHSEVGGRAFVGLGLEVDASNFHFDQIADRPG